MIELIVSISIIAFLFTVIVLSITQYISSAKDSTIKANLAILIPTGEVFYNAPSQAGLGYGGFCDSYTVNHVTNELPINPFPECPQTDKGFCCGTKLDGSAWAGCVPEFVDSSKAFCVDSRGIKKEIPVSECTNDIIQCS